MWLRPRLEGSHSWSSAHAWKACVSQGTEGSNPSLSANLNSIVFLGHFLFNARLIKINLD